MMWTPIRFLGVGALCCCSLALIVSGRLEAADPAVDGTGDSWRMEATAPTSADPAEFVGEPDADQNTLNLFEQYGGWELLFDGKSMDNFRNYRGEGIKDAWQIVNGAMVLTGKGGGDVITKQKYDAYELQLEYKISTGGNSGIMFRVEETGDKAWHTGPEIQINDHGKGKDPQKAGWLYQMYPAVKPKWMQNAEAATKANLPVETDAARPAGEWNHVYLQITPGQCQVLFNGVPYYKFQIGSDDWNKRWKASKFAKFENFAKAESGHICLQDHGNMVAFRNLKIRKLAPDGTPPAPIDGKLPLKVTPAFGQITWEDWEGVDERGRIKELRPICMTHAGDGSGRLFVGTQIGMVQVIKPSDGPQEAKMVLDLRDVVQDFKEGHNEEGLLGLAFHPNFKQNREFFVYYTTSEKDLTSIVSRFTMSKNDPNRADRDSEVVVMEISQAFHNHNGGAIEFGPDGHLYVSLGDGGSGNDPFANGQNLGTWLGKILRIDVDQRSGGKQYGIPADNPFVDVEGAKPEIYAYGFRNPWRITFDRKTGDLWEGEVGQDYWEEVNIVTKGGNYGWSWVEGTFPFEARGYNLPSEPIEPVWEYDHIVGKSITSGYVYRGPSLPELDGVFLYADYVTGKIWGLKYDTEAGKLEWNKEIPSDKLTVLAFGEAEDGEIYFSVPSATGQGIYKFTRAN